MSTEKIEPVAWLDNEMEVAYTPDGLPGGCVDEGLEPLYTASQLQAAVAAERERCAKVCWKLAGEYAIGIDETGDRSHGKMVAANSCAAAIRQLGDEQ